MRFADWDPDKQSLLVLGTDDGSRDICPELRTGNAILFEDFDPGERLKTASVLESI